MSQDARVDEVVLFPGTSHTVEDCPLFQELQAALTQEGIPVIALPGVGVSPAITDPVDPPSTNDLVQAAAGMALDLGTETIQSRVEQALEAVAGQVQQLPENETLTLAVVGHSRGGVAARLFCQKLQETYGNRVAVKTFHEIDAVPGPFFPPGLAEMTHYPENIANVVVSQAIDVRSQPFLPAPDLEASHSGQVTHHLLPTRHSDMVRSSVRIGSPEDIPQASPEALEKGRIFHGVLAGALGDTQHRAMAEQITAAIEQQAPQQVARYEEEIRQETAARAAAQQRRESMDFSEVSGGMTQGQLPFSHARAAFREAYIQRYRAQAVEGINSEAGVAPASSQLNASISARVFQKIFTPFTQWFAGLSFGGSASSSPESPPSEHELPERELSSSSSKMAQALGGVGTSSSSALTEALDHGFSGQLDGQVMIPLPSSNSAAASNSEITHADPAGIDLQDSKNGKEEEVGVIWRLFR